MRLIIISIKAANNEDQDEVYKGRPTEEEGKSFSETNTCKL
jgi:hypothetical protein